MAFKIEIIGEDTLEGAAKIAFETHIVDITNLFAIQIKRLNDVTVSKAEVTTDTHDVTSFLPVDPDKPGKEKSK